MELQPGYPKNLRLSTLKINRVVAPHHVFLELFHYVEDSKADAGALISSAFKDEQAGDQDRVNAFTHTRDCVLEVDAAGAAGQDAFQYCDLLELGGSLCLIEIELIGACQLTKNLGVAGVEKAGD
jgi:hypothetical protein